MDPAVLSLRNIHLTFGGPPLLDGAEMSVAPGDRLALVGRNGSGKSTLLKIAAGMIAADSGERFVQPGLVVSYLPQEPDFASAATTLDYATLGLERPEHLHRARSMLDRLGLTGTEDTRRLSGGESRRAALARTLAPEPDILLLDEPTNHLDLPAIEWLEQELRSMRSAVVLISHDRRFLENLSRRTLWLADGTTRLLDKGFAAFEAWRDEIVEQEEVVRHKLDRKLASEMEWLHKGVTARRKRNQGRLRALNVLRAERSGDRRPATLAMNASEGEVSGKLVAEFKTVSKSFGETPVIRDLSLRVQRGDRLGIVGPNGAGKTTLLNLLTGALAPDSGTVRSGAALQMMTLDQKRESLDPMTPLAEVLTGGHGDTVSVGGQKRHVIGYMRDFLFGPEQARTPVGRLSGGERGRLMLARAFAKPSNLLVLDEPTNDLDIETLDLLQEILADYAGTVLLVSHDRDFLDRVVTSTLAFEGDGRWTEYAGGYSDMMAQRGAGSPVTDEKPKKAKESSPRPERAPSERKKTARLSFKEKHALETLPKRIAELEGEIARLQGVLGDGKLYARDPAAFETTAGALRDAEAARAKAEDEWLMLEMKREELGEA